MRPDDVLRWIVGGPSQTRTAVEQDRLRAELAEAQRLFAVKILHFEESVGWHAWGVRFTHHGHDVIVRYHQHHPYEPHLIYLYPQPKNRHYYVHLGEATPRLCWCQPSDWQPSFRLIVGIGSAMRFLNDNAVGKAT